MSTDKKIIEAVEKIKTFKPGKPLKSFITHAVFPRFKNLEPGTRIDFDFPLTALVGANGIGKTSILHALWGMPYSYSTMKFWFSTDLDPIEGTHKDPQRYFYGYWNDEYNGIVETRKARIGKKKDYWEPYRSSKRDGMMPLPEGKFKSKAKDRWHPVKRKVVYINSRALFGSFDRYFYFDGETGDGNARGQMLREARRIKTIKEGNRQSYKLGRRERVFENRELTTQELTAASKILGRTYDSAHIVRHSLYPANRGKDLSVIFKRGSEYSEAFAGSGEISAVSMVIDILAAEHHSLILLDEPETSLHPGAQRALLLFLLDQIKLKKHQIVISTHSMEFLSGLPHEAIKVFEQSGKQLSRVIQQSSPSVALNRLGRPPTNKVRVLVEDSIAEQIVIHASRGLDIGNQDTLDIRVAPGGAEAIIKYLGTSAMASGDDVYILLDGDKRKVTDFTDPDTIPPAEYENLGQVIKDETGTTPMYHIPGGNAAQAHDEAKIAAQKEYLKWLRAHLKYLPKPSPEHIILTEFSPSEDLSRMSTDEIKNALMQLLSDGTVVTPDAEELIILAKIQIGRIPQENNDITEVREHLRLWIDH